MSHKPHKTNSTAEQQTNYRHCWRSAVRYHSDWLIDWLSMVLRLRQHNIGYTADGFYRSDDPTNSVKALKEGG